MKTKKNLIKIRSNWSLVRPVCAQIGLWSDKFALKTASGQTVPDRRDLWSDTIQTIVQAKVRSKLFPDHIIRAHPEHVCAQNSCDQGPLRSGHLDLGSLFGGADCSFHPLTAWNVFFLSLNIECTFDRTHSSGHLLPFFDRRWISSFTRLSSYKISIVLIANAKNWDKQNYLSGLCHNPKLQSWEEIGTKVGNFFLSWCHLRSHLRSILYQIYIIFNV